MQQRSTMAGRVSPAVAAMFDRALRHHQAGEFSEAGRLYTQILATAPDHADSLHLLGVLAYQRGAYAEANDRIRAAIALQPNVAAYHCNLGSALKQEGALEAAAGCYRRALDLSPDYADAFNNLGAVLDEQGRLDDAIAHFSKAVALNPRHAEWHDNLGNALRRRDRFDEAAAAHRQALALRPDHPDTYNSLGLALKQQGRLDEAAVWFRRALANRPDFADACLNLGATLRRQGQLAGAVACFRHAIALRPDYAQAHDSLGTALIDQDVPDEAIDSLRRAIALKPDFADAHNNLSVALAEQRRFAECEASIRAALALRPYSAEAHTNLGMLKLSLGEWNEGWAEYEWRWQKPYFASPRGSFEQPQWRGGDAQGRTVLIHAEQGFGDTIQFCRYVPLVAARGLRIVMEIQKPLVRLLGTLGGGAQLVPRGDPLPPFDYHAPMLSLPLAFATTTGTVPRDVPYLSADPALAAAWSARLAGEPRSGRRVGLVWAGSPRHHSPILSAVDRRRSIPPRRLAPFMEIPGLHFVSLQKNGPPAPGGFPLTDYMAEVQDFADTAALIVNLDLVVSVDTAVAHLAAALGKPVWLLDRFDHCWRWIAGRTDSPWYPALRIYRQPAAGDWDTVLTKAAADLRRFAAA